MKKLSILVAATFMLTGTSAFAEGPSKTDAAAAIGNAVKSIEAAGDVRGEWRDSYKVLGKAKDAYKKGDFEEAVKLAGKASRQGEMGKSQAMAESSATMGKDIH